MTLGPSEPPPPPPPPPPHLPHEPAPGHSLSYGGYPPPGQGPKPKGMAVASLVLGICSLAFCIIPYLGWCIGFVCGILAIIFGIVARKAADRGEAEGKGMATAGLICGIICISLFLIVILLGVLGIGYGALTSQSRPPQTGF